MRDPRALTVDCASNPDYDGTWYADQQKEEMAALGLPEESWMEYVLNRLFADDYGWDTDICEFFCRPEVQMLRIVLKEDAVTVKKHY